MRSRPWQRYAAPVAFLLAATIAVWVIRSELEPRHGGPATTQTEITTPAPKRFYTVKAGDTFASIAVKAHVSIAAIERLNPGISATTLHVGQRVRVR